MTDDTPETPPEPAPEPAPKSSPKAGDRIAKVLARAGLASRRDAEKLIEAGRVAVNGRVIDSPALDIGPRDRVTVDGQPIPEAEPPRLWLYHKPPGLVTTERDEDGRPTVFDNLPEGLPRVMSVGRLDITSEGLLLLTNDGDLKRRLELPSTGWLRKYRVRVNGTPDDASLEPLRQGITVDTVAYQPMQVVLDRQQGANAWLTVGLREGKNREVRRAMEAVGLTVNRLIRVSYGPFRLEDLEPGQVEEVRPRVLRDQLGLAETPGASRTGRTLRALKPAAGSTGDTPAKPAFAARTGKAGWLADPSASGRPRAGAKRPGSKAAGKARPLDAPVDDPAADAPRPRKAGGGAGKPRAATGGAAKPRAATVGAAKPRAAGSRSAAMSAKGPTRPRPAWGDAPRDRAGSDEAPRVRKPRAAKAGPGAPGDASDRPARAPRAKTAGADRPARKAAPGTTPGGRSFGSKGPRDRADASGDAPARPRSGEPGKPRSGGPGKNWAGGPGKPRSDRTDGPPRRDGDSSPRGARAPRDRDAAAAPDRPRAGGPGPDRASFGKSRTRDGDTGPRDGKPPRRDRTDGDRPGVPKPRGAHAGGTRPGGPGGGPGHGPGPGGPKPRRSGAGDATKGAVPSGGPKKPGGAKLGGARPGGARSDGPGTGGPRTGGPKTGGPRTGGPKQGGPRSGGPRPSGRKPKPG
jgi:23S rRNA pseudouridine2605 synthase